MTELKIFGWAILVFLFINLLFLVFQFIMVLGGVK